MYPSSFRMRAISTLSLERGTSTLVTLARTPFRIRVSRSATGSVMFMEATSRALPAGLDHAGDVPGQRQLAETDAAHLELPDVRPGPAALPAARVLADRELRGALGLGDERRLGHYLASCCVRNGMPRYWSRS